MKKIITVAILGLSLLSTQLLAESSDMYVGLDIMESSNSFSASTNYSGIGSWNTDVDSSGFKLKLGTLSNDNWRVQGYLQHERYDKTLFDDTHDVLNEIGVDVIKGFEVTPAFSPFIQAGVGYGWMNVNGYSQDSIAELSLKVGAGVMYKITPIFELLAGLDIQFRQWEEIHYPTHTLLLKENSTKLYVGANFHF